MKAPSSKRMCACTRDRDSDTSLTLMSANEARRLRWSLFQPERPRRMTAPDRYFEVDAQARRMALPLQEALAAVWSRILLAPEMEKVTCKVRTGA